MFIYRTNIIANGKAMASRAAGTHPPFPKATSQSFCILFLSYFSKSQIIRFDGLNKDAQANVLRT